ncbi:MAG: molybdopterin-synthase adenylyltransferase MoeB [Pseudomonadota bacterium]|nr:molybdopterin-synthase adenylyltransferase MoeB [Pseudomonadota bacterium]
MPKNNATATSNSERLTGPQVERYARHIVLPEVGGIGQSRLINSKVLVVGAGGLGSPAVMYLAAAGVGEIGVVDDDIVDISNLQRQILHTTPRLGMAKVYSAERAVKELNPEIKMVPHSQRLNVQNVHELLSNYDLVLDGSDNFSTRFLLNDACYFASKTLISGAILRFEGQIATYKPYLGNGNPCYRCIFPAPPPAGLIPSCSEGGVFGALGGVVGSTQSLEALKELLSIGNSLSGYLLIYDGLDTTWRKVRVKPDPNCPLCGTAPTIIDLSEHYE